MTIGQASPVDSGSGSIHKTRRDWNSGAGTLLYSISDNVTWLSVSPISGTPTAGPHIIDVRYATKNLLLGSFLATITVAGVTSKTISVSLTITSPPIISFAPLSLTETIASGGGNTVKTFQIWNGGGGTLDYLITESVSWLSINPSTGSSTGLANTIQVTFIPNLLTQGVYSTVVTVSASGAAPQSINVTLTIN